MNRDPTLTSRVFASFTLCDGGKVTCIADIRYFRRRRLIIESSRSNICFANHDNGLPILTSHDTYYHLQKRIEYSFVGLFIVLAIVLLIANVRHPALSRPLCLVYPDLA
jgi:hypothetical protein